VLLIYLGKSAFPRGSWTCLTLQVHNLSHVNYSDWLSAFLRSFGAWVIEKAFGDRIFAQALRKACAKPMDEYMKLCDARDKYQKMVYDEVRRRPPVIPSYQYQFRSGKSTSLIV